MGMLTGIIRIEVCNETVPEELTYFVFIGNNGTIQSIVGKVWKSFEVLLRSRVCSKMGCLSVRWENS